MMMSAWLLVAGRQEALIYLVAGTRMRPQLELLRRLELASADVEDGRDPSHSGLLSRAMHGSFIDHNGRERETRLRLARLVVDEVRRSQQQGAFRQLYVAAPAAFVGSLRECYGGALSSLVAFEMVGDYSHEPLARLTERVAQVLR